MLLSVQSVVSWVKCPCCGSKEIKEVIYGYLPFDLVRKKEEKKIVYGGLFMPEDAASYQCARCGKRW